MGSTHTSEVTTARMEQERSQKYTLFPRAAKLMFPICEELHSCVLLEAKPPEVLVPRQVRQRGPRTLSPLPEGALAITGYILTQAKSLFSALFSPFSPFPGHCWRGPLRHRVPPRAVLAHTEELRSLPRAAEQNRLFVPQASS